MAPEDEEESDELDCEERVEEGDGSLGAVGDAGNTVEYCSAIAIDALTGSTGEGRTKVVGFGGGRVKTGSLGEGGGIGKSEALGSDISYDVSDTSLAIDWLGNAGGNALTFATAGFVTRAYVASRTIVALLHRLIPDIVACESRLPTEGCDIPEFRSGLYVWLRNA